MSKAATLKQIYEAAATTITQDSAEWISFLDNVARFYKFSYDNNVLIYAQKPEATILATYNDWNQKVGRKINYQAKSVAVIDMDNPDASLAYYFDFSDTNGPASTFDFVTRRIWQLEEEYKPRLVELFGQLYHLEQSSTEACLHDLVAKYTAKRLPAFLDDLAVSDEASMLYGLPPDAVREKLHILAFHSILYVVFKRCGLTTDFFDHIHAFDSINHIDHIPLFSKMGYFISQTSRPILGQINKAINQIKAERSNTHEQGTIDELYIHRGAGRGYVPKHPAQRDGDREIRAGVENLHAEQSPGEAVGAEHAGVTSLHDESGGRGGGGLQGEPDPVPDEIAAPAPHGGHLGTGGTHGDAEPDSGGIDPERDRLSEQIEQSDIEPGGDGAEPLPPGSFSVSEADPDDLILIELVEAFLCEMTEPLMHLDGWPLYSTYTEIERFMKAGIVEQAYKQLEHDYQLSNGEEIGVSARNYGLSFARRDSIDSYTWAELADMIDNLILMARYPGSAPVLDDYTIPDEDVPVSPLTSDEEAEMLAAMQEHDLLERAHIEKFVAQTNYNQQPKTDIYYYFTTGNHSIGDKALFLRDAIDEQPCDFFFEPDTRLIVTKELSGLKMADHRSGETLYFYPWRDLAVVVDQMVDRKSYYPDIDSFRDEDEITDAVILRSSPVEGGRARIYKAFASGVSSKERVAMLRDEYGTSGYGGSFGNGHLSTWNDSKGMSFTYEDFRITVEKKLTWSKVAEIVDRLVKSGDYYTPTDDEVIEIQVASPKRKAKAERVIPLAFLPDEPITEQLSLFDTAFSMPEVYELPDEEDGGYVPTDEVLATDNTPAEEMPEQQGAEPVTIEQEEPEAPPVFTVPVSARPPADIDNHFNYRYSPEHELYAGGRKTKFKANVEAIRTLFALEQQNRAATPTEQIILAGYVGWGGLADALTEGKNGWETEYTTIKSLLDEDEFASAVESTTTAYYTEQHIVDAMYQGLAKLGFKQGNILDPAMGTGNFYSTIPEDMAERSRLYGVELDSISGRIARKLYPGAEIHIKGFEDTEFSDNFFDMAVGNVPFNSFTVSDRRYNKYNFRIQEYFFAKTLDKVRPGGVVAFITSKYMLDKTNPKIREYIAQRAELLGAVRLPNDAFKKVAGTEATSDIIFLKKREREIVPTLENSPWLSVEQTDDGVPLNSYFVDHPEMVLGTMVFDESMFGNEKTTACHPREGDDLQALLLEAMGKLEGSYDEPYFTESADYEILAASIPADPDMRNYTYGIYEEKLYFRENSRMYLQAEGGKKTQRIRGIIEIRDVLRDLMSFQTDGYLRDRLIPNEYEAQIQAKIADLNRVYDAYVGRNGALNERGNAIAFSRDNDAPLLRSIEDWNEETKAWDKTAIFFKPTISLKKIPVLCENADEALKLSLNMCGKVDLPFMASHYPRSIDEIIAELGDRLYQNPERYTGDPHIGWESADAYLSGEVRDKLAAALLAAEEHPDLFTRNVAALREVQPEPIQAHDISFVLGTTWIPIEYYQDFMHQLFNTSNYLREGRNGVRLEFSEYSGAYHIENKSAEKQSVAVNQTYGTGRINAYEILEATLNLRPVEVRDRYEYTDENGEDKVKYVLNKRETILAREKQAQIKSAFESWLFADNDRGSRLVKLYNDRFNNVRPRQYDGSDLILPDMSGDIKLMKHQLDVVAHGLYGDGNLLAAHEVGAGKTFSAIAIAYEMKRIGAVNKPLIAVPNHLIGQWAAEFMRLYPGANILVATEHDFEKSKRRRFCSRISTGDYDAIIMGHSSFELINLSRERQLLALEDEINEIMFAIDREKQMAGKTWSLKQMQIFQKNLQSRYDRLYNADKKDDVVDFEELGVDMIIVDEAHAYKNNYTYSKMRNVAGIGQSSSQRAMDMHLKCQYINQINNGRGVVFLTGTPVTNSMSELFVMQRFLQPHELQKRGLLMFDAWASTYGKVVTALEITPEGNGYQMKTRFAKFHNLPELMAIFTQVADIKTADMLNLPVPKLKGGEIEVVKTQPTQFQKAVMDWLVDRAEAIRAGEVNSNEDNFLKLTLEARVAAVDPRILSPDAPDDDDTKLAICAKRTAEIYHDTADKNLTQIIFCDTGTPQEDFNFYDATKDVLIAQGVDPNHVAFIHDAKTDPQRQALFEQVRKGQVRILMGSTGKMGTGMNVQNLIVAVHHLDIPWRPADLTQRNGRGLRQGNENEEISIINYITEDTFDGYMWQTLENKQRYIAQIMTGRSALRSCEDIDSATLQYAQFKALAISDPRIKEKMEIDNQVVELQVLKSAWQSRQATVQSDIHRHYPDKIKKLTRAIENMTADIETYRNNKPAEFSIVIGGNAFDERVKAGEQLIRMMKKMGRNTGDSMKVGYYAGFEISLVRNWHDTVNVQLCGKATYQCDMGFSELGNITRIENIAKGIADEKSRREKELADVHIQLEAAKAEAAKPFDREEELVALLQRKSEIDTEIEFKDVPDEDELVDDEGVDTPPESKQDEVIVQKRPAGEPPFALREKKGVKSRATSDNDRSGGNLSVYDRMANLFGEILVGKYSYMNFESEGYNRLVIENIGGSDKGDIIDISMAHYYEQNGDQMRDPEITYEVHVNKGRVVPTSYQQDSMGLYYEVENDAQRRDLMEFTSQWLTNIAEQGFELTKFFECEDELDLA